MGDGVDVAFAALFAPNATLTALAHALRLRDG
jgi:hypothetical protein